MCGNKLSLFPIQNGKTVAWKSLHATIHKQTRSGSAKQKYDSFDNQHSMNHLAQTELFNHQSFVYVFSQSAPQHEGSFVVGLCVGKECDKDFKGLDKSTLSFGQSPVIQQAAKEGAWWGAGGRGRSERRVENSSTNQLNTWTAVSTAQIIHRWAPTWTDRRTCTRCRDGGCGWLHSGADSGAKSKNFIQ